MSIIVNEVRHGTYLDSVALMRIAQAIRALPGVEECGLLMGTPANRRILDEAGVLAAEGKDAGPGDLVIAVRAIDGASASSAIAEARRRLEQPAARGAVNGNWAPRTIRAAVTAMPGANLALISVPGAFAAAEAHKALMRGLNVMMFSDNVSLEDEIALKQLARGKGLLMMGPDCGTAILSGVPLAFANVVPRGAVGIIGASGTGIQEVSCQIARRGGGISHAIGTGGRDLKQEVGAITTLSAIDLLEDDDATRHIVLISKPPAAVVAHAVLERIGRSRKRFTVCFVGSAPRDMPPNAIAAETLEDAAALALGMPLVAPVRDAGTGRGFIRGLFAGGTLCAEAQTILRNAGLTLASNVPLDGVDGLPAGPTHHTLIDLGDDAYTVGRPHPMIEPAVRDEPLKNALADASCAVVLLDCVLGHGAHPSPASHLARILEGRGAGSPVIVASVTGTDADPQGYSAEVARLEAAGVCVAASNADAARLAIRSLGQDS